MAHPIIKRPHMIKSVIVACAMALTATNAYACQPERILALNMFHEARGEGEEGMKMIADVTMNRVKDGRFPKDICAVVKQKNQFTWTKKGYNIPIDEQESWNTALRLARGVLNGTEELPDTGAIYFTEKSKRPSFLRGKTRVRTLGNHAFYK